MVKEKVKDIILRHSNWPLQTVSPTRKIKVVILTNVGDTGGCDRNGQEVHTGTDASGYMKGAIETLIEQTSRAGELYGLFEIVGVIYDDTKSELEQTGFSAVLGENKKWIFPLDLTTTERKKLVDITFNLPSTFRNIIDKQERQNAAKAYEKTVSDKAIELGADIILTDHYMEPLVWLPEQLKGRLLNIQPGLTLPGHKYAFSDYSPTADAIACAQTDPDTMTGATFRFYGTDLNKSTIIAYRDTTPVRKNDQPEWLRFRNYMMNKLPVLIAGMKHYALSIYPQLNILDLTNFTEMNSN